MTRWSANQLNPNSSLRSPLPSPRSTPHTYRAQPGTSIRIALSPAPIAPTLLTHGEDPAAQRELQGVNTLDTCQLRRTRCLSAETRLYTECISTACTVGVYSPVSVDGAIQISECGRSTLACCPTKRSRGDGRAEEWPGMHCFGKNLEKDREIS